MANSSGVDARSTIDRTRDPTGGPRARLLRRLALAAGVLVTLWLAIAVGVRVAYAERILPGTTMADLSLGGRSPQSAGRLLSSAFAPARPLTLVGAGRRIAVDAAQLGYRVDAAASAERARDAGRTGPLGGLWSTVAGLLSARRLEPVVQIDRRRLSARIAEIARGVDRAASPGELVADADAPGAIRSTAPRTGQRLDRDRLAAALLSALRERRAGPVAFAVRTLPTATPDQVRVVVGRARRYLRSPMRLVGGRRTVTLTARQTAGLLALEQMPGRAAPRLGVDARRVERLVSMLARDLDRAPTDARIHAPARPTVVVDGQGDLRSRPRRADVAVTPSSSGRRLRRRAAAAAIGDAVGAGRHAVALTFERSPARVRTGAAREVTALLGTFTTRYPCCQPRVTNIRLIARAVDGTVILPGERFSLNTVTGERTRADGYVEAPFIADGRIVPSVGGGVSQFSTTLYNAAYLAGLRIDAHQPHSFYIDRYPAGREATLNFPDIDLMWTNDTSSPVLIRAATDATSVVVSLYGADHGRRVRALTGERAPVSGGDFTITVTRVLRFRDGRVARQPYTTRYDRPPPPE